MRKFIGGVVFSLFVLPVAEVRNVYIPVAGVTPGRGGTFWRTDVRIYNPSPTTTIGVTLSFLIEAVDGTSATGAIRIDSDKDRSYEFVATSRTYTNTGKPYRPGTYGQRVPALDPATARSKTVILNFAERPDVRTNIGAMNPALTPSTLRVRVSDIDGTLLIVESYVVMEANEPLFSWASVIDNYTRGRGLLTAREATTVGDSMFVSGAEPGAQP